MCGPRRQWVSQRAFELMKEAWTDKDELRGSRPRLRHIRLFPLFRSWQVAVGHLCDSDVQGCATVAMSELRKAKRDEASCLYLLRRMHLEKRSCSVYDRETHWREIANSSEAADTAGDARSTYRLIRALGAFRATTLPGIKLADGSFALDAEQESERWHEHFAALLCFSSTLWWNPLYLSHFATHEVEEAMAAVVSLKDEVQRVVTSLPNNKALGKDMIPSELWKATGSTGDVPSALRGGRLACSYKNKGPTKSTDSHRGLLIGDHTAKLCTGVLAPGVKKAIEQFLPPQQCGSTKGGVTNRGHHLVSTFVRHAQASTRSQRRFCSWTCLKHSISWCDKSFSELVKHAETPT